MAVLTKTARWNWRELAPAFVTLAIFLAMPLLLANNYQFGVADQVLIFVVLATGYNLLLGYTGMVSLGHIALFAIGAYTSGILSTSLDLPFAACVVLAGILTGLAGALIAIPGIRIRGHYLTLLTLALGQVIGIFITNLSWLTGGSNGLSNIPRPIIFGHTFRAPPELYYLLLFCAVLGVVVSWRLERSRFGLAFKAIRDAETSAEVCGVDTALMKILAFAVSAVYAGVAGSLYAHTLRVISPDFFNLGLTITLLAMVLIGGRGTIIGPVVGAALLTILPEALRFAQEYYLVAFGLSIWAVILFLPDGLAGRLLMAVKRPAERMR